jgi:hypothetical protein
MKFRILKWSLGVAFVAFAAIGAMHTTPLSGLLRSGPSCPIGGDMKSTPTQRESARLEALGPRKGSTPSPARAAFGFELGKMSLGGVEEWIKKVGATCTLDTSKMVRECTMASLTHFGVEAPGTVFFRIDDRNQLVALLVTAKMPIEQATVAANSLEESLEKILGRPQTSEGTASEALLSQSRNEHRFSDLFAAVTTTQMGDGVRVSLEVQSL